MAYMKELQELFLMQQTYATLMSVTNKVENQAGKYFKGLTSRQYMAILAILHLPPNETTLKNIAQKLGTTKQNANQLLSAIERKGHIIISHSDKDKRAVNITVTESGMQAMLESAEIGVMFMADVFKDFTARELTILWDLLKKLHCFDGNEFAGFEENIDLPLTDGQSDLTARVLEEFKKKRKH